MRKYNTATLNITSQHDATLTVNLRNGSKTTHHITNEPCPMSRANRIIEQLNLFVHLWDRNSNKPDTDRKGTWYTTLGNLSSDIN